jgi:hypothetical protein
MNKQSKSYKVTLKTAKAYSIILSGFQFATSLFFRIRDRMNITYIPKFRMKANVTLSEGKLSLLVSRTSLIANMIQTISGKTINSNYIFTQRMKAVTTIVFHHPFMFIGKAIQKLLVHLTTGKMKLIAVATVATFFNLGYYDPSTLLPLDSMTLGAMDYA